MMDIEKPPYPAIPMPPAPPHAPPPAPAPEGQTNSDIFVLRMTSDNRPFFPARWRMTAMHVRSGERRLVSTYDDLNAFIEEARRIRVTAD